ncbi:GNAT family N-acetyltransferase [Halomonas sp. RA08-2]|uniref:GNAT family N-acetyltransferase n=1 Tax=Halomonas sp. RA08-2 TaxID=3440842 RepID=UPI003EECC1A6
MTRIMLLEMLKAERARVIKGFLDGVDLDDYVDKLLNHSEILVRSRGNRCLGILAFYCNDSRSRRAFISLLLVAPEARGHGIAREMLEQVMSITRSRRFHSVGIEVSPDNRLAQSYYHHFGFHACGVRNNLISMEIGTEMVKGVKTDTLALPTDNTVMRVAQ